MDLLERNVVGLVRVDAADAEDLFEKSLISRSTVAREHHQPPVAVVAVEATANGRGITSDSKLCGAYRLRLEMPASRESLRLRR